nr:uncharacterized protein LOC129271907 [Lytechinus pictus]
MSDRASTEKKWHELLESFRKDILPEVVQNWGDLTPEDRAPVESLTNFFCGLHSFVQLAEVAGSSILEVEQSTKEEQVNTPPFVFKQQNESGTVRLIRTASKAFARTGDQKSGCYGDFKLFVKPYLDEHGMRSVPLCPFRGNRFNIVFFNAAHVYFLYSSMRDYLSQQRNLNGLLKAVKHDLSIPMHIAGCRALGLLDKLVTRPLWRVIEDKDIHILQMNRYIQDLITYLDKAQENLDDFMTGQMFPFDDKSFVKIDAVYDCLIKPSEHDADVQVFLSVILPAMSVLLKKQYGEHLPGGVHFSPSPDMHDVTKSVAKHNKFAERVLAYVDHLLRSRPNSNHLSQEAMIMFALNKTGQWINMKEESDRQRLIKEARKDARKMKKVYQERREAIVQKRNDLLKEKLRKEEERKEKQVREKELMTQDIIFYGLWQSRDQVEQSMLSIKSKSERLDALKAQLRFRQHILSQEASPVLYRFSESTAETSKRRNLTCEELKENLISLITKASTLSTEKNDKASQFLVGKRVKHYFKREGEGEESCRYAVEGKVISTVPGYPDWFNIKYADDEAIYSYKLLEDLEGGDLEIIV